MALRNVIYFNSQAIRKYPGEADEFLQGVFFDQATTVPTVITSFGQVCVSEAWKAIQSMQVCISEAWKPVVKLQVCVGETWKDSV
jgi:hypothetical protein